MNRNRILLESTNKRTCRVPLENNINDDGDGDGDDDDGDGDDDDGDGDDDDENNNNNKLEVFTRCNKQKTSLDT